MHHAFLPRSLFTAFLFALGTTSVMPAHAVGRLVDVQIVDRQSGETLTPIRYRNEWWIAGRPGARYGVTLSNRGERTLGVLSIDGVNAITGDTAAWSQSGVVLEPYEHRRVDGWQKNDRQAAAFEFTALADSYAARTGRAANVGVIGIALFTERVAAEQSQAAPAAPAPASRESANDRMGLVEKRIGTGHGALENAPIFWTTFDRRHGVPDEIVLIRYDRLENLVALGIVPPPARPTVLPAGDAFPASHRYVADPPARR